MRHISIILLVLVVYIAGCAHNHKTTEVPSAASPPSLHQNNQPAPSPAKQKTTDSKNDDGDLTDEDLDFLYEEAEAGVVRVADPFEPLNRVMFHFNDKLYFWVLKPAARGYRYLIPSPVRAGVKNFFRNLTTPVRLTNCILQGKFRSAGVEVVRFLMNSTAGMLGFGNPAQMYPQLSMKEEDLGQTFGTYGIGNGFYIVWPFLGPSSIRDSVGMIGDRFLNPITYVQPTEASIEITAYEKVNDISFRIGDYEAFKEASLDPYSAIRDAYIQNRNKKVEE